MSKDYENENLYSETELLRFIYGLANIYHSKPWYLRWMYSEVLSALETLAIQLCGEKLEFDYDQRIAIEETEDILDS